MKRIRGLVLVLLAGQAQLFAQEIPEFTPERQKLVLEIVQACLKEGGLKRTAAPDNPRQYLQLVDREKVKTVLAARRQQLGPDLREALLAYCVAVDERSQPVVVALLEVLGQEAKDDFALGLATFFTARAAAGQLRLAEASKGYRAATQLFERAGQKGWQCACLNNQGTVLQAQGAYAEAAACCKQALEVLRQLYPAERYPEGHFSLVSTLINVGHILNSQGSHAEAIGYFQEALQMARQLYPAARYPKGHPLLATCLNNLGGVLKAQGLYQEALGYLRQVLDMQRRLYPETEFPDGHPDLARAMDNVGYVLRTQGDYAEASALCQQAYAMRRKLYPDVRYPNGHPELAFSLSNLGSLHQAQGLYGEAVGFYQQALDIQRQLYPESRYPNGHPDLAKSLNNLGHALQVQGRSGEAAAYYQRALKMQRQLYPAERYPNGHPDLAKSLNNLGLVSQEQGSSAEAVGYYRQTLEILRQLYPAARYPAGHPDLATALSNLASALKDQSSLADAADIHQQGLRMRRQLYPETRYPAGHPDLASSLSNLGLVLQLQGSSEEALRCFDEAAQSLRITAQPIDLDRGAAAAAFLRPLPLTAIVLTNRAHALQKGLSSQSSVSKLRVVERAYSLAAALYDRLRTEVLHRDADKLQQGETAEDLLPHRLALSTVLFSLEGKSTDLHNAFAALEQRRARVFLEALGETHAASLAGLPDDLRREERRLSLALRQLDAHIDRLQEQAGEAAARQLRDLYAQRLRAEHDQHDFTGKLRQSHPGYAGFRYPQPCSVDQARDCLADNEVALLFALGDPFSHVMLVEKKPVPGDRGEGLAMFAVAGGHDLASAIGTLLAPQTLLRAPRARDLAAELYGKILGPLSKRLAGKDLVIVADGCLELLPFEMLVEGQTADDEGHWLIEKHRVRYAPSLTALHLSRQAVAARKEGPQTLLWALADPIFEDQDARLQGRPAQLALADQRLSWLRAGQHFGRLAASGREVEAICRTLGVSRAEVLRDSEASEANVKAASARGDLAKARYVHFATHGLLGLDRGQPPGLVLNLVGNDGQEDLGGLNDGFLRLPEVTFLKLNADLVVLSACETARGSRARGEGVSGLARAFLYAGSKGVICSLWSVDDAQTADLMADLYRGLKDGQPSPDALRAAQLRMIGKGRAPFFWAPFVLVGQ